MPVVFDWNVPGESFGGGGTQDWGTDTPGRYGYSAQSDIPITAGPLGWSDVPIDPGLLRDKIVNGNGEENGEENGDFSFMTSKGGALILGLIILGASGFRG